MQDERKNIDYFSLFLKFGIIFLAISLIWLLFSKWKLLYKYTVLES